MVSPMNAVCMQYIYIYIAMKKTFDSDKTTSIQLSTNVLLALPG